MNYSKNTNLDYYIQEQDSTNCGSYALRLNEWYDLDEYFAETTGYFVGEWIVKQDQEGYDDYEISIMYQDILVQGMLEEFHGELEVCDGIPPKSDDVELIAFSTFCYSSDSSYSSDFDYHFKVFRDGKWMEKCGTSEVRECDIDDWGKYIDDATFFYHKLM